MVERIKTAGGAFDSSDRHIYFIADGIDRLRIAKDIYNYLLIAINELDVRDAESELKNILALGRIVLLDSGIFNLAMEHVRKHGVTLAQALATPPEQIDGFDALYDQYIRIVNQFAEKLWGYIELDQGREEDKTRTRAQLEAQGLRPIPVYHPLSDGWDYFDYLAERYDRICVGNMASLDFHARKRILATIWERRRKYPDLWIHLLGLTPTELFNAYPVDSCDSSAWLVGIRWPSRWKEFSCGRNYGLLPLHMRYQMGAHPHSERGDRKAVMLLAYQHGMLMRNLRNHMAHLHANGFQIHMGEL